IGVVNDPNPVGGVLLGPMQLVVSQTQQPEAHSREMRNGEVEYPIDGYVLHRVQGGAGSPQRYPVQYPAHHQEHLYQGELMARGDQLECWIRASSDRQLGAGGDCSIGCCRGARSCLILHSRAAALARHRSRDRRKSRTSVRNALIPCCRSLYFAFQSPRLFSKTRTSTRAGLRYDRASWSVDSETDMVCGSIRNKGLLPTTDVAQQISLIPLAQFQPKKPHFHQPRAWVGC